ncbi:MAG: dimethyl sulfoxide reductase anchor subunit [Myxococcales bacterium]|nr:dimethyl sulfoxide reductase anchor subunit [Myxococcales bacterium]
MQVLEEPRRRVRLPLVQALLDEQRDLSAVERFSQLHQDAIEPLQARYYRDLLPARPPAEGQQYAFEVDLDRCSGCKACVTACHSQNGLDPGETWRSVGLLHGGSAEAPVQKTVTTACHHCLEPGCLKGCPVGAYEKDAATGIVRHLDDQCIGCQYCIFTCPYEVPQLNKDKGIVRKCDMCSDRLAQGEAPACVQACPNQAIAIAVVDAHEVQADAQGDAFLPAAPSPGITLPSTRFKTSQALPRNMLPADFYALRPARQHMPLVLMLVLTQLAVGAFGLERLLPVLLPEAALSQVRVLHGVFTMGLALLALGASTAHLGRPQYAFRAILGIRSSWLSREIATFGGFAALGVAYAGLSLLQAGGLVPATSAWSQAARALGDGAALFGLLGLGSSIMLYSVTGRRFWSFSRTSARFVGSAVVLGLATALLSVLVAVASGPLLEQPVRQLCWLAGNGLALATALKLATEASVLVHLRDRQHGELKRSAVLLSRELARLGIVRFGCALLGGVALPLLFIARLAPGDGAIAWLVMLLSLSLLLAGELLERMTYFAALSSPRMPGGLS